jgi:hypothetical protein
MLVGLLGILLGEPTPRLLSPVVLKCWLVRLPGLVGLVAVGDSDDIASPPELVMCRRSAVFVFVLPCGDVAGGSDARERGRGGEDEDRGAGDDEREVAGPSVDVVSAGGAFSKAGSPISESSSASSYRKRKGE